MEANIKDMGHGTYFVNGRIVRIMDGCVDPSTEQGSADIARLAANMDKGLFGMLHGPFTVLCVSRKIDGPNGPKHLKEMRHPKTLPADVRERLRKEVPGHADEF